MSNLVTFVPCAELDAQANLAGFVDLCKSQLAVFGADLKFEENTWDAAGSIEHKGKYHAVRIVFSNLETSDQGNAVMMREPFLSFAKAYVRYQHGMRPTQNVSGRLVALRAVEAALAELGSSHPVRIDSLILNRAAQKLSERLAVSTAYRAGGQLEMISEFLCDNRLTAVLTRWRNPLKRPRDSVRIGKEFDEYRAKKMPSQATLDGLPKAFLLATEPSDVLVTSLLAILCSAPDRINECLLLPENCEVKKQDANTGKERYGLRWWPAKGALPMIKWVIPSMSDVVADAVGRIRRLTEEARRVAKWYEAHPNALYLPAELEHLRAQEWLNMSEVAQVLFAEAIGSDTLTNWCRSNRVSLRKHERRNYARFADVQAAVLQSLPAGFPIMNREIGLTYSNALCVMQRNTLESVKTAFRCIIEPIAQSHISSRLGARSTSGILSIFDRCGLFEPDGSPIRVTSHQFRHYLNTLAQVGGMSQLDIAKWSGRKDVRQNEAYDHESNESLLARIRVSLGDDTRMFGPLAETARAALISRDEFERLKVPTAHTTDFGYCIHDYVMSPCQIHRDCLNCDEQVCIKGEEETEARIRLARTEATRLLAMAEQAEADGEYGATEWVEHHRLPLARLNALCEIFDNPRIPHGAIVRLMPAGMPSWLEHAAEVRAALPSPELPL